MRGRYTQTTGKRGKERDETCEGAGRTKRGTALSDEKAWEGKGGGGS